MAEGPNPLLQAFDQALARLGATALSGNEESVAIGYGELELGFGWADLEALLKGGDPAAWTEAIAEAVVDAAAGLRAEDDSWSTEQTRLLPVLLGREAAEAIVGRAPELLAYPYAEALLITVGSRFAGGFRYLLRPQLEAWEVGGEQVIAQALANLRRETAQEAVQEVEPELYALDTGDGLDSSRLLILDELAPTAGDGGLLAIAPAREVLSFAPFTRTGTHHLRALVNLATRCHESWPYPITNYLFYVAPRTCLPIPVSRDADGTPRLTIPETLADVQARLVAEGKW